MLIITEVDHFIELILAELLLQVRRTLSSMHFYLNHDINQMMQFFFFYHHFADEETEP